MTTREYDGMRVLVTGAASGVGEACARLFGARGAAVAVVDRDGQGARRVAEEVAEAHDVVTIGIEADVSDASTVQSMVATAVQALGGLDAAHLNAATMTAYGDVLETQPEQWDLTMDVNLRGAYLVARELLPVMVRAGGGALCFTGSDTAIRTSRQYAAYLTSKHGLLGLARSIAVDFGPRGIRSNLVSPGVTDTPGLRTSYSTGGRNPMDGIAAAGKLSPLGRVARPEEVAEAVAFLCSSRAAYITGANLMVDGAMTVVYEAE